MYKDNFTVTIGIPVFNEAQNLSMLMDSILRQKATGFTVKGILVICDGCTDTSAQIARTFKKKLPQLRVFEYRKRLGKSLRLNELFKKAKTDILVCLDGDSVLAHTDSIAELVAPFRNPKIAVVGGNDVPTAPKTFFESVAFAVYELWYETRKSLNGADNIHNIHGPIFALRRQIYQICQLPSFMNADDANMYIFAKTHGFGFAFAQKAVAFYRLADNFKEYMVQHTRYLSTPEILKKIYGDIVFDYYQVPLVFKLRGIVVSFFKNPIFVPLAILLQLYLRVVKPAYLQKTHIGKWQIASSSKAAINV